MNILITNDDSWSAKGIHVLVEEMLKLGHVTVIAPQFPQSGQSNAITVQKIITLDKIQETEAITVYTTNGTPSDCIKLAMNALHLQPNLVVSGINHGSNAAVNTIYSGTMGACFVAAENGIPAIGFSLDDHHADADFEPMRQYILPICQKVLALQTPHGTCYNVNAPKGEIKGVKLTHQTRGHWTDELQEYHFPDSQKPFYLLKGHFVNLEPDDEQSDEWALAHGYLSICPQTVDMTDHEWLRQMKSEK